jgi:molybdopterin-synthase adenylyltransferase
MERVMNRFARQSFLGLESSQVFRQATVGFVGLGGGGSHCIQQAAHIGIGGYVLADPDRIEKTNTNRLVGGTLEDVRAGADKVSIAERMIRGLVPDARITAVRESWRSGLEGLRLCDVILGGVDSYTEREQLERFARRSLIPYADIGMDVHDCKEKGFLISGQVILSLPGHPCMRCCGFITDERLKQEAERYGAAGARPQVVWPNGVLASTAVGLVVQLLTPWHADPRGFAYLEYDGNRGTVVASSYMRFAQGFKPCPHFPPEERGDPCFDIRSLLSR